MPLRQLAKRIAVLARLINWDYYRETTLLLHRGGEGCVSGASEGLGGISEFLHAVTQVKGKL